MAVIRLPLRRVPQSSVHTCSAFVSSAPFATAVGIWSICIAFFTITPVSLTSTAPGHIGIADTDLLANLQSCPAIALGRLQNNLKQLRRCVGSLEDFFSGVAAGLAFLLRRFIKRLRGYPKVSWSTYKHLGLIEWSIWRIAGTRPTLPWKQSAAKRLYS